MPLLTITYAIDGGSTGATVTGLPAGVTGVLQPVKCRRVHHQWHTTATGTYQYIVKTHGSIVANPSADSGTINVNAASTISLSSSGFRCTGCL